MFLAHSTFVEGEDLAWVAASGVEGVSTVTVPLGSDPANPGARRYTVRLVFAEPDDLKPGDRVFDVSLQGSAVLTGFDVVGQAGARNRAVVREFPGVTADKELTIGLKATTGKPILSGVEIVAEGG